MRAGPLVLLLVLLGGCARSAPPAGLIAAPERLLIAFADGFHSGVLLARADAPPELLPPGSTAPWIVYHFGERRWISGEADGVCDALRLAVAPGEGGVQADAVPWWVHSRGGTRRDRVRVWAFPVSAQAMDGVRQRLRAWIAADARPTRLRPGTAWWASVRAWSLRTNCHDFTVDILAGAGIAVARPPVMLAPPLRAALDEAWSARDDESP